MKQVRETNAGQSISAWIVLDSKGHDIATIQAFYGNAVTVNVFNHRGDDETIPVFQEGRAGGYGYDKFTAALSGLNVAGLIIPDHCGKNEETEKLLKSYHKAILGKTNNQRALILKRFEKKALKIGGRFANYQACDTINQRLERKYNENEGYSYQYDNGKQPPGANVTGFYESLFLESGLDYLRALGYRVHQAI